MPFSSPAEVSELSMVPVGVAGRSGRLGLFFLLEFFNEVLHQRLDVLDIVIERAAVVLSDDVNEIEAFLGKCQSL